MKAIQDRVKLLFEGDHLHTFDIELNNDCVALQCQLELVAHFIHSLYNNGLVQDFLQLIPEEPRQTFEAECAVDLDLMANKLREQTVPVQLVLSVIPNSSSVCWL